MTSKISLTAAVFLFALSGAAVAGTAHARPHQTVEQARQSFNWAVPTSVDEPNAHRYHGGPKSND